MCFLLVSLYRQCKSRKSFKIFKIFSIYFFCSSFLPKPPLQTYFFTSIIDFKLSIIKTVQRKNVLYFSPFTILTSETGKRFYIFGNFFIFFRKNFSAHKKYSRQSSLLSGVCILQDSFFTYFCLDRLELLSSPAELYGSPFPTLTRVFLSVRRSW